MHNSELLIRAWTDLIFLCAWPFFKPKIKGFVFASYYSRRVMNDVSVSFMIWLVDSGTCSTRTRLLHSRFHKWHLIDIGSYNTLVSEDVLYWTRAFFSTSRAGVLRTRVTTSPIFLVGLVQHCHPVARMQYYYRSASSLGTVSATGFRRASQQCEAHYVAKRFSFRRANNVSDRRAAKTQRSEIRMSVDLMDFYRTAVKITKPRVGLFIRGCLNLFTQGWWGGRFAFKKNHHMCE